MNTLRSRQPVAALHGMSLGKLLDSDDLACFSEPGHPAAATWPAIARWAAPRALAGTVAIGGVLLALALLAPGAAS
jgi:hypothetical protein